MQVHGMNCSCTSNEGELLTASLLLHALYVKVHNFKSVMCCHLPTPGSAISRSTLSLKNSKSASVTCLQQWLNECNWCSINTVGRHVEETAGGLVCRLTHQSAMSTGTAETSSAFTVSGESAISALTWEGMSGSWSAKPSPRTKLHIAAVIAWKVPGTA